MKKAIISIGILSLSMIVAACGDATVVTANESYEQRIVIEGYLQAGRNIERIYITRNFPVTTNLSKISLIPDPDKTTVQITDLENNQLYPLTFKVDNPENLNDIYWTYDGSDFVVQEGKRYQLEVWTTIGGKSLYASSVTTVPNSGFEIISLNHQQLHYRERDLNDNLIEFQVELNRSTGTTYYAATVQALNPSLETFIYDNPYGEIKPEDVDLIDDALSYEILHHAPEIAGVSKLTFGWHVFNFYDRYRIIIFAADQNYKDFFMTYGNVMEMDGNFHEAKFNIEGDGIGVFGSVIADTVYVDVVAMDKD